MLRRLPLLLPLLALLGCPSTTTEPEVDLPDAIVAADRSGHWLDRPWPAEEVTRADGSLDWTLLPEAPTTLGTSLVAGWANQAAATSFGASHMAAVWFRFESEPEIEAGDVGIMAEDGTQLAVTWRWIESAEGDPFLADRSLLIMPETTSPMASDTRYIAWVSDRVADPAEGWINPAGTPEGVAIATAFTVQDSAGELLALNSAADAALDADPTLLEPIRWQRVTEMRYEQGETPSGEASTVCTVTYEDGSSAVTYLSPGENEVATYDLTTWPHEVWEGEIQTVAFQPWEGRPWASPGVGLLTDFNRIGEGWIRIVDGAPEEPARPEEMRIVVQIPREGAGPFPVVTWDHGTGGHAWNAVARTNPEDRSLDVNEALGDVIIVSRDQPLYGTRYPLIDEGFGASLGFYNIGNLPAFRDNQRQAAVDHRVLRRFVEEELPALVPSADPSRLGAFGHSLGSVTMHGGLRAQDGDGAVSAFASGAGGYLGYYVLQSGLLGTGNDVVTTIAPLIGLTPEQIADATPAELVAALIGLPESAWPGLDASHPVMQLFGVIMDPSDPLMFAAEQTTDEVILLGLDDWQVPEATTRWLAEVSPAAELEICTPLAAYDGHYCTFREDEGIDRLARWAAGL